MYIKYALRFVVSSLQICIGLNLCIKRVSSQPIEGHPKITYRTLLIDFSQTIGEQIYV
jgi:hypothetical protein